MIRINNSAVVTERQFLQRRSSPTKRPPLRPEGPRSPRVESKEDEAESRFPRRNRRSTQSLPERTLPEPIRVPERIHKSNIDPVAKQDKRKQERNDSNGSRREIERSDSNQICVGKRVLADSISGNSVVGGDKYAVSSASVSSKEIAEKRIGTKLGKGKFQTPVGAIAGLDTKTPSAKDGQLAADSCPEDFFKTMCPAPRVTEKKSVFSENTSASNAASSKTPKIENYTQIIHDEESGLEEKEAWDRIMEARDNEKMKWSPKRIELSKTKVKSPTCEKKGEKEDVDKIAKSEKMPLTKDSFVSDLIHALLRCE
mmetsp:Transcript_33016/g.49879  ORF Transcript_33016/g.49879 Transcript_33016/m.49879 type:complete len:313 (-) Transcript_33016:96-1034(-)|eukprot:CAMPEP_0178922312 /NCGR_PEP_ID=MMETSP0786-20121207/16081_1 /TAXON_ID=186022 /ORGANISM="Thalassionema frauenfeldii, Strain CCMP 1798" /LENGTH=312 /DNA_ID=CAMNT_0020596657 /DNA_START=48 /DNA_END=986 /DNA_ORIENTATION=+